MTTTIEKAPVGSLPDSRPARRRQQFELERRLRRLILDSAPGERQAVTYEAYEELFRQFPDHAAFITEEERLVRGQNGAAMIAPLVSRGARILEVGCGLGDVLCELAKRGFRCEGTEVSDRMIAMSQHRPFKVTLGTADDLRFPGDSFDLVFSLQVLEHLHPDDVKSHLRECYRVLQPGGVVAIETPNRTTGPQDVSRGFTAKAQGLHLKEWSVGELSAAMREAGFVRVAALAATPVLIRRAAWIHRISRVPAGVKRLQDWLLRIVPTLALRTFIGKAVGLDDIFLFARKPLDKRKTKTAA